jgi:predicted ribosome quality control (RQC) complex YloA/Tae2 family protein
VHTNHYFLKKLVQEISQNFANQQIEACFSQEKDELVFAIVNNNEAESFLKCIVTPEFSCLFFVENYSRARKNSVDLWPEIIGLKIKSARVFENERALEIKLEKDFSIVFKFFGNRPNILLYQNDAQIALFNNKLLSDKELVYSTFNRKLNQTYEVFEANNGDYKKQFVTLGKIVQNSIDQEYAKGSHKNLDKWEIMQKVINNLENPEFYVGFQNKLPCLSLVPIEDVRYRPKPQ